MDKPTNKQMKKEIDDQLTVIYPQLLINAQKVCTYNFPQWGVDLIQHVIEYFLKLKLEKQYFIITSPSVKVTALERYLTSAMSLAVRSSTSPFYTQFRKHMESHRVIFPDYDYSSQIGAVDPDEEDYWADMIERVPGIIKDLHFYDKYLIQKHYIEGMTVSELSEITQITCYRLSRDIKLALLNLKEILKKK